MGERIRFSHKLDFCPPSFKKDKILVKVQKLVDPDGMSFMGNYISYLKHDKLEKAKGSFIIYVSGGPANLKSF